MVILLLGAALAASLSGQILSWPEGEPLDGVAVIAWDLRLDYEHAFTDEEGRYTIDGLSPGYWRVLALSPDAMNRVSRYYPAEREHCDGELIGLADDEALTGVDLALPEGGTLRGRLVDPDGAPVPGVDLLARGQGGLDGLEREASTDEDGYFTLTGLDEEEGLGGAWTCEVDGDGWPDQYLGATYEEDEAQVFEVAAGEELDLGDQPLLEGVLVTGAVIGPDGPVADASVHVYASSQVLTVETDADGQYEAVGLPPGEVLTWTRPVGLANTYYPDADRPGETLPALEEGEVLDGVDLHPPLQAVFNARLIGEAGEDLSGVTGLLYNDALTVGFGARAEESGELAIEGLHGGDYTLYLFAADEGYADDFVRGEDGEPVVFTVEGEEDNDPVYLVLEPRARLEGTLVDDAGQPVAGGAVLAWPADDPEGSPVAASAEDDGTFVVNGLAAGRYRVEARVSPWCDSDPGWVTVWWPDDAVNEAFSGALTLDEGEVMDGLVFTLPRDGEQDGMGDAWEERYGLDTGRDDSAEDPDGDGYTNLEEYLLGTDPTDEGDGASGGCGCGDKGSAAGLLLVAGLWRRRRR